MLTISVTRSRVAAVLGAAAEDLACGWDPWLATVQEAIDRAADYVPGRGGTDAEAATLQAWDALERRLSAPAFREWELTPGRTRGEVVAAVRAAAELVGGAS